MLSLRILLIGCSLLVGVVVCGCGKPDVEEIASGVGISVTRRDLLSYARELGVIERRRFAGSARRRLSVVRRLTAHQLLLAESRSRGLHRRPTVRREIERLLVALLRREVRFDATKRLRQEEIRKRSWVVRRGRTRRPRVRASVVWRTTKAAADSVYAALSKSVRQVRELARRSALVEGRRSGDTGFIPAGAVGFKLVVAKTITKPLLRELSSYPG
jgi:hypothetical protein